MQSPNHYLLAQFLLWKLPIVSLRHLWTKVSLTICPIKCCHCFGLRQKRVFYGKPPALPLSMILSRLKLVSLA